MPSIQLRDGRQLAYTFFGVPPWPEPDAAASAASATEPAIPGPASPTTTLLTLHGFGSSMLEAALLHKDALHHGLTLLAIDRPGAGCSTFNPAQSVESMAEDVRELLDGLGLERVAVMGASGGAPFACACAALLAERVSALLLVCPLAPVAGREEYLLPGSSPGTLRLCHSARHHPCRLWAALHVLRLIQRVPHGGLLLRMSGFAEVDVRVQRELPDQAALLSAALRQGLAQGVVGAVRDLQIFYRDVTLPPSALAAIACPTVIWHGTEDLTTPAAMGQYYAESIPGARLHLLEGEGHLSLPFRHNRAILGSVMQAAEAVAARPAQPRHRSVGRC